LIWVVLLSGFGQGNPGTEPILRDYFEEGDFLGNISLMYQPVHITMALTGPGFYVLSRAPILAWFLNPMNCKLLQNNLGRYMVVKNELQGVAAPE